MDYEIKYKEALERAKTLIGKLESNHIKGFIYDIFPELKESEDEKIRKELLSFIQNWKDPENIYGDAKSRPMFTKNEHQCDTYIAWLEKQGEQKPSEEYNITGIGSKHAQGKLAEKIKELKPLNEILEKQSEHKPQGKTALEAIKEEKVDNINKVKTKFNKVKTTFQRIIAEQEFGLHNYSPRIRNILMPNSIDPDKIIADMTAEQFYKLLLIFNHAENIK